MRVSEIFITDLFGSFIGIKGRMSSISLDYYGYDISDYVCSNMSSKYSDDEPHKGSLSACEESNESHEYDGELYKGYDSPRYYD